MKQHVMSQSQGKENQKTSGVSKKKKYMNEAAWLWDNRVWWGLGRIREHHLRGAATTLLQLIVTTENAGSMGPIFPKTLDSWVFISNLLTFKC